MNFEIFPQFLQQSDKSLQSELPAFTDDMQETKPLLITLQIPRTETLQVELSHDKQWQHSGVDENVPLPTPLGLEKSPVFQLCQAKK